MKARKGELNVDGFSSQLRSHLDKGVKVSLKIMRGFDNVCNTYRSEVARSQVCKITLQ